jgi:hypothetical protein
MPPTIFVTAFNEYAVRAFDVNAIDYLLQATIRAIPLGVPARLLAPRAHLVGRTGAEDPRCSSRCWEDRTSAAGRRPAQPMGG